MSNCKTCKHYQQQTSLCTNDALRQRHAGGDHHFEPPSANFACSRHSIDENAALLQQPIGNLPLATRSKNCLFVAGVSTIGELVQRTEDELLTYRNFGPKSIENIQEVLASEGLSLGMEN